jgi:hypothetical protein
MTVDDSSSIPHFVCLHKRPTYAHKCSHFTYTHVKIKVITTRKSKTLRKRGQHSEHLGGLCGGPLAEGADSTVPSERITYMSSGNILSFCTPAHVNKLMVGM